MDILTKRRGRKSRPPAGGLPAGDGPFSGAAETGPDMSHPFFGMEVSAQPNNDKYDLYLTMFCELAVANPVYLFMNVPAGSGVDLTQPQHVEITVTPDKEFSVSIKGDVQ